MRSLGKRHKVRETRGPARTLGSSITWVCVGKDDLAKTENGVERRNKMWKLRLQRAKRRRGSCIDTAGKSGKVAGGDDTEAVGDLGQNASAE